MENEINALYGPVLTQLAISQFVFTVRPEHRDGLEEGEPTEFEICCPVKMISSDDINYTLPDDFRISWESSWNGTSVGVIFEGQLDASFNAETHESYVGLKEGSKLTYRVFKTNTTDEGLFEDLESHMLDKLNTYYLSGYKYTAEEFGRT